MPKEQQSTGGRSIPGANPSNATGKTVRKYFETAGLQEFGRCFGGHMNGKLSTLHQI
jgi:hypothetical protein